MLRLFYKYLGNSNLPRRTFIVNVQLSTFDTDNDVILEVIAPDQILAQEIVRRHFDRCRDSITFWTYAIREVVTKRDGTVYVRPFMLEGKTVRFPYMNGVI
jgi:hypothetical protein